MSILIIFDRLNKNIFCDEISRKELQCMVIVPNIIPAIGFSLGNRVPEREKYNTRLRNYVIRKAESLIFTIIHE